MEEDDRITETVGALKSTTGEVAVCTDDIPGKPERYIAKVQKLLPSAKVVKQFKGPVANVVSIIFQQDASQN